MDIDQVLRTNLTPEQYAAAVDPAAEVVCLACAGSGKSRTLAYRIARLLAEGEPAESIVAFTFTDKAAESIKRRVSEAFQAAGLDPTSIGAMYIGTIHGYCQRVLGLVDPTYRQYDVLDENRLKLYLMSRYAELGLREFRARARSGSYFDTIKQVSDAWKTANDELLDIAMISIQDPELGDLLNQLQNGLRTNQYIDFSLMIRNVVEAISNMAPSIAAVLESLRHLMVDEYQDVNPCQEELIQLLHQRSTTLFAVGDDDQAIYAWRGADVSNIIGFRQRYPGCSSHTLSDNFRSTTPIVESSDNFIAATLGPTRIGKSPIAHTNSTPQHLGVLWFPDRTTEANWVSQRISALIGTAYDDGGTIRGLTPGDFAVLMRSTRQQEQDGIPRHAAFTSALQSTAIPFSLEAGGGPFDRVQTQVLRSTFELLRTAPLDRSTLRQHFDTEILSAYPYANFDALARVLNDWQNRIHRPVGAPRIRLLPQQLVYSLLEAFRVSECGFDDDVMRDIGLFSRMILDVETVYMSVDSSGRFADILNFLQRAADTGYDVSTDDVVQRPDAVAVSTVHKMKGLEFPCVFIVDVEAGRFPKRRNKYEGWLPGAVMSTAIARGAYQSTPEEEARLFYTAATRAERYLYVTGAADLPLGLRPRKRSAYALQIALHPAVTVDISQVPIGLTPVPRRRRVDDADYPTSFTEIKYYLECPKSYQFRERYGLNPAIPDMFGYGRTVHTVIQKLHEHHPTSPPAPNQIEPVVESTFHLKHVPQSQDPVGRPGAYENAKNRAVSIASEYVADYGDDFTRQRQVEAFFEIPSSNCLISGSIDLLLHEDSLGNILGAEIIDFKTMEGGDDPTTNSELDWTELALQVQLYARAADQVLGQNAKTGNVHLLKDGQRIQVPITTQAIDAALSNIEWAVTGILESDFPMRPHPQKCRSCDFQVLCSRTPQEFQVLSPRPPELHLPNGTEMVRAFSRYQDC